MSHKEPKILRAEDLPYRPCVGVMVINRDGLVWAGRRIPEENSEYDGSPQLWQMPQGGIDKGETPEAAALRELWEETGVTADLVAPVAVLPGVLRYDLPPELLGKVWKGRYRGQEQHWFLFRFLGRDEQIDIATEHPEFSEWRWLRADEVLAAIVPFKRAVYEAVIAGFREHLA